jgi:hypothetical protein
VTIDERPVERSVVKYRLLCHLAGEPERVLTKVNFENKAGGRQGERGVQGARGGIGDPLSPGEALAA